MKYCAKILIIISILIFICSCSKGGNMSIFKNNDKKISDSVITDIVSAIEERNPDKLSSLFSQTAKNDSKKFDDNINEFFSVFSDKNLKIEENVEPIVYDDSDGELKTKKLVNWYQIFGDENNYTFFFIEWVEDTKDKDNIGLYTLRIIAEEDFNEQFLEHSEMEIPGIYYKPSKN